MAAINRTSTAVSRVPPKGRTAPHCLEVGYPAPWFRQRSTTNPNYCFDTAAGRYIVLCFFGTSADDQGWGIRLIKHGSKECAEVVQLRDAVMRKPLGLAYTEADLAAEAGQLHFAAYVDGKPTASVVLQWIAPGVAKMRQVAVRPDIQRQGLGRLTVEAVEAEAERRGARKIVLHARRTSVAFYLRQRYEMTGELFEEIGLPHCRMHKSTAGGEVPHIPVSPFGG